MQYLLHNKVNYSSNTSTVISFANDIITSSNASTIKYSGENVSYNNKLFRPNIGTQNNRTSFDIYTINGTYYANVIIINLKPSFTCSNIIAMTNNDSVTYTLDITKSDNTHVTKVYSFILKKQFMNTPILTDVISLQSEFTKVKISATSTLPLTLLQSKNYSPQGANGEILIK